MAKRRDQGRIASRPNEITSRTTPSVARRMSIVVPKIMRPAPTSAGFVRVARAGRDAGEADGQERRNECTRWARQ